MGKKKKSHHQTTLHGERYTHSTITITTIIAIMEHIEKQVEEVYRAMKAEVARIAQMQAKLDRERSQPQEDKKLDALTLSTTVRLNVGGRHFVTTVGTLRTENFYRSLSRWAMGAPWFKSWQDHDGSYAIFIDRPGAPFEHILNYLQTGVFIPPTDPALLKAVKLEADFYQVRRRKRGGGCLLMWLLTMMCMGLTYVLFKLRSLFKQHECTFYHADNHDGVLHWLGTQQGTAPYQNPVDTGLVRIYGSSDARNAVERTSGDCGHCHALDKGFRVELPLAVRPTRYCLSYPTASGCWRPANWSLSASADGKDAGGWTTLCAQTDDRSLIEADRASWPIADQGQAFRHFQLTCTGPDESATCHCFHVCGFELYGRVHLE
jgi:hypothetical protein